MIGEKSDEMSFRSKKFKYFLNCATEALSENQTKKAIQLIESERDHMILEIQKTTIYSPHHHSQK